MLPTEVTGTQVLISGFSIQGIKGMVKNGKTIVFIVKGGYKNSVKTGASADIQALIDLAQLEFSYVEIWSADSKRVEEVSKKISVPKAIKYLNKHNFVMIVYSGASGQIVKQLSKSGVKEIIFRAQNPEFVHRMSYFAISKNPKFLVIAMKGLRSDFQVVRYASQILPISEYDLSHYFRYIKVILRSSVKLKSVTYQVNLKEKFSVKNHQPFFLVGSSTKSTLISSVDSALQKLVKRGGINLQNFQGIGYGLHSIGKYLNRNYGFQKNPDFYLKTCPVIVIPTKKGWGFKTKVLDFLSQGKIVVVHKKLARKIDPDIRANLAVISNWKNLQDLNLDQVQRPNTSALYSKISLLELLET
jgi:glutaredoxin-related protein